MTRARAGACRYDFGGNGIGLEAGSMAVEYCWRTLDAAACAKYLPIATLTLDFYIARYVDSHLPYGVPVVGTCASVCARVMCGYALAVWIPICRMDSHLPYGRTVMGICVSVCACAAICSAEWRTVLDACVSLRACARAVMCVSRMARGFELMRFRMAHGFGLMRFRMAHGSGLMRFRMTHVIGLMRFCMRADTRTRPRAASSCCGRRRCWRRTGVNGLVRGGDWCEWPGEGGGDWCEWPGEGGTGVNGLVRGDGREGSSRSFA